MKFLLLLGLIVLNVMLWYQTDVATYLIANDKPTLLGRYSVEHFTASFLVLLVSLTILYIWIGKRIHRRQRTIKVIAFILVLIPGLIATDLILRLFFPEFHYVYVGEMRLRPPHYKIEIVYEDLPMAHRTFPVVKPGYPAYPLVMSIDERGFRNPTGIEKAELILIGDSFTEGSRVSDDQVWGQLLESLTGLSVYNIANSGDDPQKYLSKLSNFGLKRKPHTAIVMIYEGNDFRRRKSLKSSKQLSLLQKFRRGIRFSPLRAKIKNLLINVLGPINADAPIPDAELIDWLPLAIQAKSATQYYAIKPKNLGELSRTETEFLRYHGWLTAQDAILAIRRLCEANQIRLVLAYAPSKAHVVLPLVLNKLDSRVLYRFAQLDRKKLPQTLRDMKDSSQYTGLLFDTLSAPERVLTKFAREQNIELISLTIPLRKAVQAGQQVYFTYDQHWTPMGHEIAAESLVDYLMQDSPDTSRPNT